MYGLFRTPNLASRQINRACDSKKSTGVIIDVALYIRTMVRRESVVNMRMKNDNEKKNTHNERERGGNC